MTRIIDISPTISARLAVFPGDVSASRDVLLDKARGDAVTLSTLRATVHLGAHVDAPCHYGVDAATIESMPLERCIGSCQVIRVTVAPGGRVTVADLPAQIVAPRVLIATESHRDRERWTDDFVALDPALVDFLADQGVVLIGVDTPSVDLAASKDLPAHARCLARDVTILEGIVLADVAEGLYELIALPLKLEGFDASPVRAVLRT